MICLAFASESSSAPWSTANWRKRSNWAAASALSCLGLFGAAFALVAIEREPELNRLQIWAASVRQSRRLRLRRSRHELTGMSGDAR